MQTLLDKRAKEQNESMKSTRGREREHGEVPDASDMRAIKLISQHVYTQRTAAVYYLIVG